MATGVPAIAEGTIDFAFGYWREICRSHTNAAMATSDFAVLPTPSTGLFPNVPNFTVKAGTTFDNTDELDATKTISNYKIIAVDPAIECLRQRKCFSYSRHRSIAATIPLTIISPPLMSLCRQSAAG